MKSLRFNDTNVTPSMNECSLSYVNKSVNQLQEIQQGTNVAHNIMGGLQIIAMFHW